jgi:hypothetical protein
MALIDALHYQMIDIMTQLLDDPPEGFFDAD